MAVSGGILLWLALVRTFRWRRYNSIHRKYGPQWNNGQGNITPEEAQEIMAVSIKYDMPMLLNYSVAFALFKTYAIVRTLYINFTISTLTPTSSHPSRSFCLPQRSSSRKKPFQDDTLMFVFFTVGRKNRIVADLCYYID
jgi:hypothetical protein